MTFQSSKFFWRILAGAFCCLSDVTDILARQRRAACQLSGPIKARKKRRTGYTAKTFSWILCDILSGIYSTVLLAILSDVFVIV